MWTIKGYLLKMVGLGGLVVCGGVVVGSVVHYCLMAFQSVVESSLLMLRLCHFGA